MQGSTTSWRRQIAALRAEGLTFENRLCLLVLAAAGALLLCYAWPLLGGRLYVNVSRCSSSTAYVMPHAAHSRCGTGATLRMR